MNVEAKTYGGEGLPMLEPHQFSVSQSEVWTGIVLTLDGRRRTSGSGDDWLLIFDCLEDAESFATKVVAEKPDVECWVRGRLSLYERRIFNRDHA